MRAPPGDGSLRTARTARLSGVPARSVLILPLVAATAAVVALALPGRPWVAVATAAAGAAAVGTALDRITGRHRARRLEAAADETGRLLEWLPLPALTFVDGALAAANPAARTLLGASDADADLPEVDDEALLAAVAEAIRDGAVVDTERALGERQVLARAVPVDARRVVVLLTDTTETRRVEALRRDFVTNASHELKTPAAGMQALAESLAMALDRDPARARHMVERLEHESVRLSTMVRDLLDLARLEDEAVTRPQPVDLAAIATEQRDRFAEVAGQRDITIDVAGLHSAVVLAPPEDVRLVVANLVENAVRYNREGGHVAVVTHVDDDHAVLEVRDTGIGLSNADQQRVFERFYRVDKARSRAAGGTGLGLSLVRHATQRNGGSVTVRSTLGEGSTFRVTFPLAQPSSRSPVTK